MRDRDPKVLVESAVAGDRPALARLLSIIERGGPEARQAGRLVFPRSGAAYTVGITGGMGAGKSTLTDRLISTIRTGGDGGAGLEVAVLAVDPSSPFSGGAFLGDRIRMQSHALDRGVFIRSMATRGHLGGLALASREAVRALDAAGFPWVLLETVGVGQVEIDVADAADTTMVVLNPGAGDSVQANKAGLLEVADVFVVNKADRPGAKETERDLIRMLEMSSVDREGGDWMPPVLLCSATSGEGVADVWAAVANHRRHLEQTAAGGDRGSASRLDEKRRLRIEEEVRGIVVARLEQDAYRRCDGEEFQRLLDQIGARRIDPYTAAEALIGTE